MLPGGLAAHLRMPLLAPCAIEVPGPDFLKACVDAGVLGSFCAFRRRTSSGYGSWLKEIRAGSLGPEAPWAVEYPVHCTNERIDADLRLTIEYEVPILISTISIEPEIVAAIHAYGGLVFHDAPNARLARRAIATGVDGIILAAEDDTPRSQDANARDTRQLSSMSGERLLVIACCANPADAIRAGADLACVDCSALEDVESVTEFLNRAERDYRRGLSREEVPRLPSAARSDTRRDIAA